MVCGDEDEWSSGMCELVSIPRYAYTALCPCFVSRNIMRKVMDAPNVPDSSVSSIVNCLGCGICMSGLLDMSANIDSETLADACVVYTGVWCCTIPIAYLLRTTVCERLNKRETWLSSLCLSMFWWPCMLTQTEREEMSIYGYE